MTTSYENAKIAGAGFAEQARALREAAGEDASYRDALRRDFDQAAADYAAYGAPFDERGFDAGGFDGPPPGPFHLPAAPADPAVDEGAHGAAAAGDEAGPPLYERREEALRLALDGNAAGARAVDADALRDRLAPGTELSARELLAARDLMNVPGLSNAGDAGAYGL